MKQKVIFFIVSLIILFGIIDVSAQWGVDVSGTTSNDGWSVDIEPLEEPINYSLIPTVNASDFWDSLDTPADISLDDLADGNSSWVQSTSDNLYLFLSGSNANQNIDIGVNNLSTGRTFNLGNGVINYSNGNTFGFNHGIYILGSNPFLDVGGKLLVGDYARIDNFLTVDGNASFEGNLTPLTTLLHDIGSGPNRWRWLYVQNISTENIDVSEDVVVLGDVYASNYYGSGANLTNLNVTGVVNVSGDFTGYAINTSYLYGALGVGGIDMRADPWYFSGADFEIDRDLKVNNTEIENNLNVVGETNITGNTSVNGLKITNMRLGLSGAANVVQWYNNELVYDTGMVFNLGTNALTFGGNFILSNGVWAKITSNEATISIDLDEDSDSNETFVVRDGDDNILLSVPEEGNVYVGTGISADDFIEYSAVFDKSKGSALDFIHDADYYLTDGKIDHKKFYGNTVYEIPDLDNCEIVESWENGELINISNCGYKTFEGNSISKQTDLLEQAIYEQQQIIDDLIKRIEVLEKK